MKKVIVYSFRLFLFLLFFSIFHEQIFRGLRIVGRFSAGLPIEELFGDFQRGLKKASKLSNSAVQSFYEGFVVETERVTDDGDTIILRHQKSSKIPTVNIAWDSASIATKLKKKGIWEVGHKSQLAYIRNFQQFAIAEMMAHGIPASIKLAQGILESGSGNSPLCRNTNNHFGVKCYRKNKKDCYGWKPHGDEAIGCFRAKDDEWCDHFCIYPDAKGSYSAQSVVLMNKRYARIFSFPISDRLYKIEKGWYEGTENVPYYAAIAVELKRGGYATSDTYHAKISTIINDLELWRIDFAVISQTE